MEKQGIAPEVMVAGGAAGLVVLVILLAMTGDPGTPVGFLYGVAVVAIVGAVAGLREHAKAQAQAAERVAVTTVTLTRRPMAPAMVTAGAAGLAVLVISLALAGEPGTPVGFLYGVAVVAILGAVAGLREHAKAQAQLPGEAEVPVIRLVDSVPAPRRAVAVAAMAVQGSCALGFKVGDRWTVDAEGRLSRPLCEAAVAALALLLQRDNGGRLEAECKCPLKRGPVTFALQGGRAA